MKINEVITESNHLDEISASGIGKGLGKVAHATGAVAGGVKGAWDAAKAGYQSGRAFVGGQRVGGGSAPRGGAYSSSAVSAGSTVNYPQVVNAIPNMNADELKNLKQKIDTALQAPSDQVGSAGPVAQSGATKAQKGMWTDINGKKYMFAGNAWVDEKNAVAQGDDLDQIKSKLAAGKIPPPSAKRPPEFGGKPETSQAATSSPIPNQKKLIQSLSKLKPDQLETVRTMLNAKAQGQQNVAEGIGSAIKAGWNKLKNLGGLSFDAIVKSIEQMTPEQAKGLLSQLPAAAAGSKGLPGLSAPTLQPKNQGYVSTKMTGSSAPGSITTGGISRLRSSEKPTPKPAEPKAAAPSTEPEAAPSPYGKLTSDESAFVAAREREGLTPDQIQTALTNRRNRAPKLKVQDPGGPRLPASRPAAGPGDYDWASGIKPGTKLSDIGPVGAAAKKTAANEEFYSKFLGKDI